MVEISSIPSVSIEKIDYLNRDYEQSFNSMRDKIASLVPDWTDNRFTDIGIAILSLVAYNVDLLSFYLDFNASEAFLSEVRVRENAMKLSKGIDYHPHRKISASVELTVTLDSTEAFDVVFPEDFSFETTGDTPYYFLTTAELTIITGNLEGVVSASEGTIEGPETFYSNATEYQIFLLAGSPQTVAGTNLSDIIVTVNSVLWEEKESLTFQQGNFFKIEDYFDRGIMKVGVRFGDGVNGNIPENGAQIKITYRDGNGVDGNVGSNSITVTTNDLYINSTKIDHTVTNLLSASGGVNEESIESIKYYAPRKLRTLDRAVTEEDFVTLTEDFEDSTYGKVSIAGIDIPGGVQPELVNLVDIYVLTLSADGNYQNWSVASTALKTALKNYLDSKKIVTVTVNVIDGSMLSQEIILDLELNSGYTTSTIIDSATGQTIQDKIELDIRTKILTKRFNETLFISDIYHVVKALTTYVSSVITYLGLISRVSVAARDNSSASKPTVNPTIDGHVVALDDRILFTALTGGEAGDNNKVWKATGSLGTIIWTLEIDGQAGDGSPTDFDMFTIVNGTTYAGVRLFYETTAWVDIVTYPAKDITTTAYEIVRFNKLTTI